MRDYAAFTTLITRKLQSAGTADYSVAEVDDQIEESLKELSNYHEHTIPVIFKIESRTGTDVTGTASKLTDSVKKQFLTADATDEKVIHNVTDNTWAVVLARDSTSVYSISANVMAANESYEIFNKHCTNKRQIYIGDIVDYPRIDSVEYPIGTRRNWKLLGDVLEIDVNYVPDSNSTLTTLPNVDVLVRFNRPHILSQLTDWTGAIAGTAAVASGTTAISATSLQSAGTIEIGEEFYLENHRTLYVVTTSATIASNTASISFFPGLEAAATGADVISFRKSSLSPQDEEILARLAVGHLMQNKAPKFINSIPTGGGEVSSKYYAMGSTMVEEALKELRMSVPSKTRKRYATD